MNTVYFTILLLSRLAQSSPDSPVYVEPPSTTSSPFSPIQTPAGEVPFFVSPSASSKAATPLVMAYYPDWAAWSFPPEKIDFARFDWIDFAFAIPEVDGTLIWDDDESPQFLTRLVTAAHKKGKKVKLSIGGWTDSQHFSTLVSMPQSRQAFANNISTLYKTFHLDGIDIDWEYPGRQGAGDNEVNDCDSDNFLVFLKLLRSQLPPAAIITAATTTQPFDGSDGKPMPNVSDFAAVLNWVLIMNYDAWGASANPGPNAPLSDYCRSSSQPEANAAAAYDAWTRAGFPADKLVLGVPSYAYISNSTATKLQTRGTQASSVRLSGDGDQIQFCDLVKQHALFRTSDRDDFGTVFEGDGGFTRNWDKCSSTPFLRSPHARQVVTYDDPQSLGMKAAFVKRMGMRGVNLFDVHGDTPQWDLTDSLRRALGL